MRPSNLAIAYLLSLWMEGAHAQNNFPNRNRAPRRNLQGSFDDGRFKLPEDAGADPVATEGSMSVSFEAADLTTAEFDRFQVPTTAFPVDEMMSIELIADDLGPTALPSASPITKFPSATPTGSPVKGTKALKLEPAAFDLSSIGDGSMSLASLESSTSSPTSAPTDSPTIKGAKSGKDLTQFMVDTSSNGAAKMANSGKGSNDAKSRTKAAKQPGGSGKESKESEPSEDEPSGKDSKSNDSSENQPIFSKSAKRQRALRMLQEEGSVSMSMSTNSPTPPQMDFGRFDVPDSTEFLEVESSTTSTSAPVIAKSGKNRKKKRRNRRRQRRGPRMLQDESLSLSLSFSYPDVDLTIADVVVEELITPEPTSSPTASPTSSPTAKADKQPTPNTSTKTLTQFMLTTSDNGDGSASGGGSPAAGKSGKTRRKMAQKGSVNKLRALQAGGSMSMSTSMSLPSLMEEFPTIVESTTEGPTASPSSSPTSSPTPNGKAEKIRTASMETSSITQFAFTGGTGETSKGGARKGGSGKGGSGKGGSGKGSRATDGTEANAKSGKTQRLRRKQ